MRSWVKSVFVVSCAVVLTVSSGLSSVARPGDGDTQMQVQVDELTAKIKANPKDFDAIADRGLLYRKLRKLDLCESDGKILIQLRPTSPFGYWLLSRVAKERNDPSTGLKWIRESIKREKPDADHFHYELDCLQDLKMYSALIARSVEIEKQFPKDAKNFYYRAVARYYSNQEASLVRSDLNSARRNASQDPDLLRAIDEVYKNL